MTALFEALSIDHTTSPLMAVWMAAGLGLAGVFLSPCHLGGIPLAMGVARGDAVPTRTVERVILATLLGLGLIASLAVVALITLAAGRILGDLWGLGPTLAAVLTILAGLVLLDLVPLSTSANLARLGLPRVPVFRALVAGTVLGITLGPCTFGFFAPVLSTALGGGENAIGLVLAFLLAHLLGIVLAGVLGLSLIHFFESRRRVGRALRIGLGLALLGLGLEALATLP